MVGKGDDFGWEICMGEIGEREEREICMGEVVDCLFTMGRVLAG